MSLSALSDEIAQVRTKKNFSRRSTASFRGESGWHFLNVKNAEHVKEEILAVFSEEPGDGYTWSEQDIWEQSRKIIDRWNRS